MTTDQVCQVQQEKMQARPCPGSHPVVSSTPRVEAPPLVTCPWATLIQAACRRRPLSRPAALSTATLNTFSITPITQHRSPRAPCSFRSRAVLWCDPVLCLPPAPVSAAAATAVVAATQPTTTTRYGRLCNIYWFIAVGVTVWTYSDST